MTLRWERRELTGAHTMLMAYQGGVYVGHVSPRAAFSEGSPPGYRWCIWVHRNMREGVVERERDGRRRVNENWAAFLRRADLQPKGTT